MEYIFFVAFVDDGELAVEEHDKPQDVLYAVWSLLTAGERMPLEAWLENPNLEIGRVWVKGGSVMVAKALPLTNSGRLRESLED